jgi:hypothetical protein
MALFSNQSQIDYAANKRYIQRMRGDDVSPQKFTATFDLSGSRRDQHFYFTADNEKHARDSFQRFLGETLWFEIPCAPEHVPFQSRTADVRGFIITYGWPPEVETWPSVQDLNESLA